MNDYSLIFEAYRQKGKKLQKIDSVAPGSAHQAIQESVEAHKLPQSLQQINTEISALFQKHGITVTQGSEAFWIGVQDVLRIDRADGKRLQKLAQDWETAHKRENVVKPHLKAPVAPTAI